MKTSFFFLPANPNAGLLNLLQADHRFENKIEMKQTGRMKKNQQHTFIKENF
jgi:hypothetical protein